MLKERDQKLESRVCSKGEVNQGESKHLVLLVEVKDRGKDPWEKELHL